MLLLVATPEGGDWDVTLEDIVASICERGLLRCASSRWALGEGGGRPRPRAGRNDTDVASSNPIADACSLGAAVLAAVGAGLYASVKDGADAMVRVVKEIEPDRSLAATYDNAFAQYRQLYPSLKGVFHRLPEVRVCCLSSVVAMIIRRRWSRNE